MDSARAKRKVERIADRLGKEVTTGEVAEEDYQE